MMTQIIFATGNEGARCEKFVKYMATWDMK